MAIDTSTRYFDADTFLPNVKWLIERALKDVRELFNPAYFGRSQCKACGCGVPTKELAQHLNEHAAKLKLIKARPVVAKGRAIVQLVIEPDEQLVKDVDATIFDTLTDYSWDVELDLGRGPLTTLLRDGILLVVKEEQLEPRHCADCGAD